MVVKLESKGSSLITNVNKEVIIACATPQLARTLVHFINEMDSFVGDHERQYDEGYSISNAQMPENLVRTFYELEKEL